MCARSIREILQVEDSLSETVQLVGKDSLSEDQKVCVAVAVCVCVCVCVCTYLGSLRVDLS